MIILSGWNLKQPAFLKVNKQFIFKAMRLVPALEGYQVLGGTEHPLVIGFKHSFLQELLLVFEQFMREFLFCTAVPVENEAGPDHDQ